MRLRAQVFIFFGSSILIFIVSIYLLTYSSYRKELQEIAKGELKEKVEHINQSVEIMVTNSVKNYLRGITERQLSIIKELYNQYLKDEMSLGQMKDRVQKFSSDLIIGETGYLVCVEEVNGRAFLDIHPHQRGQDCTETEGCQKWVALKNGYLEYDWINPADENYRQKVAYIEEFQPLSWIVGASTYKDELATLVQVDDIRNLVGGVSFKETGYFFLFDENDRMLIHPEIEGQDVSNLLNDEGVNITKLFKETQRDFVYYNWRNPSEKKSREKIAYIAQTELFGWNLVGSVYFEEINEPVRNLERITVLLSIISSFLLIALGFLFSRNIEKQLNFINSGVDNFYQENKPFSMKRNFIKEIAILGTAFEKASKDILRSRAEQADILNLLENIINSMPSALIAVNEKKEVLLWNGKAAERTGYSQSDAIGRRLVSLSPDLDQQINKLEKNERLQITGERLTGGKKVIEDITFFPLTNREEKGSVILIDDITEQIQMKEALQQSRKMDALGQLTGGIAHDFNNMLAGILNTVQLLDRITDGSEKAHHYVQMIRDTAIRAAELTKKLLQFSRKNTLVKSPAHLHDIINKAVNILYATIDRKITINMNLDSARDEIEANFSQLQNVVLNMGINASHAIEGKGNITISTAQVDLDSDYCRNSSFNIEPGDYIRLEIEDNGAGIPEDIIDKIFDPFFTTKEQGRGTGLGLSTAYGAIKQHGGSISVSSKEEKGTVFTILLPLTGKDSNPPPAKQEEKTFIKGTILIIEDEEILRLSTEQILSDLGHTVLAASDGEEGITIFKEMKETIDIVFTDMIMPKMNGREVFSAIKGIRNDVKVIFCSGFTMDEDIEKIIAMGARGFVTKPYDMDDLSSLINKTLSEP